MDEFYNTKTIYSIDQISIPEFWFILLWWKRKSGKWVLVRNLLKKITDDYDIWYVIVFWKTSAFTHDYDFIDNKCIYNYDEKTEDRLKKLMEFQEKNIKNKNILKSVIVFDDIT